MKEESKMKIFDYTNGTKGKMLGETKVVSYEGSWFVEKNGVTYKITIAKPENVTNAEENWEWHEDASFYSDGQLVEITPEQFGVGAICFCKGEVFYRWHAGHPEAKSHWEWTVIGTNDWNRDACKSGILNYEKIS